MKIPLILAQETVAVPRYPRHPGVQNGGGLYALGAGLGHVSQSLAVIAQAEEAKRLQFAKDEAANAAANFELATKVGDADLRIQHRDPDRYMSAMRDLVREAGRQSAEGLTTEEGKALYAQKVRGAIVDLEVGAKKHENALYIERGTALRNDTVDAKRKLAAMAPLNPDDLAAVQEVDRGLPPRTEFARHYREVAAAISGATPLTGAVEAGNKLRETRQNMMYDRAYREIDANPAANVIDRYRGELKESSVETLSRVQDAAQRRLTQEQDAAQRKVEKDVEATRQLMLTDLTLKASTPGGLTSADLEKAVRERVITKPAEVDHLRNLINSPPGRASDQDILLRLGNGVRIANPTVTADQITRAMDDHAKGLPGLNVTDGLALQATLTSHLQRREDQAHSRAGESHRLALNEGKELLGLNVLTDQLDQKGRKLSAEFTAELASRTLDRNGNYIRPAREAMYEILPKYLGIQSQQAQLGYRDMAKLVGSMIGTPPSDPLDKGFLEWYAQAVHRNAATQTGDPNGFALRQQQLQAILRARKVVIDQKTREQSAPTAPRPGMPATQRSLENR